MDNLVDTDWLAGRLGDTDLLIVDASSHLPSVGRDAREEFEQAHIPGGRFLDLANLKDTASPVPNALPTSKQVAARLAEIGYSNGDRIVIYDDSDVKTSARAWFALHRVGVETAVLDGGFGKWRAEGREIESGASATWPTVAPALHEGTSRCVRTKEQMIANIGSGTEQVIDARDIGRFTGATIDTVHDLPGGHIPGARHLFFRDLYRSDGTFRPPAELRLAFETAGVDLAQPIVTSCGSGVTASVLLFALHLIGVENAALYDGSWSEWGADPATPKETGPAS